VSDSLRITANISLLFLEVPLLERFEVARSHGFDGVEIQFPYAESAEALSRAAEASEMPVVLINAPVISSHHPYGIAGRPEMTDLFRAQLAQADEYAEALGAKLVHILAGQVSTEEERETCLRTYESNLDFAVDLLRTKGVTVVIEPLNSFDVPGYLLNSFDLARSILSRRAPEVGMQFDVYHVARMGLDLLTELERALPLIRHLQFADFPGRHEPGTGILQFREMLRSLIDEHYAGCLGAEYFPSGATDRTLGWLATWRATMASQ
jgi:hydroxypyruvate isomerase